MKLFPILYILALTTAFSCSWGTSNSNNTGTDDSTSTIKGLADTDSKNPSIASMPSAFTCVPNEKIGLISANDDEKKVIEAYGAKNIIRKEIGIGEGELGKGSIVFSGHKNQMTILWDSNKPYEKIQSIRVDGIGADWKTKDGIQIGSTLEELMNINGEVFKFAGFEWDYAGRCNDWGGGNISPFLTVYLEPGNMKAVFPDLLGDELIASDLPKAKEAQLKVISMEFSFE